MFSLGIRIDFHLGTVNMHEIISRYSRPFIRVVSIAGFLILLGTDHDQNAFSQSDLPKLSGPSVTNPPPPLPSRPPTARGGSASPAPGSASTHTPAPTGPPIRSSIPYVATRNDAVNDMLWMANVGKDDVVYDLGSGDGRIVIAAVRDFGARRAVGIENDPERIRESRANARKAGMSDRVEFIQGDLFNADIGQASVVTLFLGHNPNLRLRPELLRVLKPGTRIVSHQFGM